MLPAAQLQMRELGNVYTNQVLTSEIWNKLTDIVSGNMVSPYFRRQPYVWIYKMVIDNSLNKLFYIYLNKMVVLFTFQMYLLLKLIVESL